MEITALHHCTTGLDIHHRQITACVLKADPDHADEVVSEFRVFRTHFTGRG